MSEDNKARIREFIDRVLTAGEINATGDYGGSALSWAGSWA